MQEKYFILKHSGYDGISISSYETEKEAIDKFNEHKEDEEKNKEDPNFEETVIPAITIKGSIIQNYKWDEKYL